MNTENTKCHSSFSVCSEGEVVDRVGFVASPNSDFDPELITQKLQIVPYKVMKMGTSHKSGHGVCRFSSWSACYQDSPALDAETQCINIVRMLQDKLEVLLEIKKEYNVYFIISIVPHIYNEETPILFFNKEIIEFCYKTGTEISINLYVYDKE